MKKNKNIEKTNKAEIIKMICDATAIPYEQVSAVMSGLEKNISRMLSSASKDNDIEIKLLDGLILESRYKEAKIKRNNLTGEVITVPERLNVSGRLTRLFEKKINQ